MKKYQYILLLTLFLISQSLSAQTIRYVNLYNGTPGDGLSWDNSYNDLQVAIDAASAGDTLWVALGAYTPSTSFNLKNGVVLLGGFSGTETSATERNWGVNTTLLNGNGASIIINNNLDNSTVLDGFNFADNFTFSSGAAAIDNIASSPTINNCVFRGNYAFGGNGGAIVNEMSSSPVITNCVFRENVSIGNGGAISNNASSPIITNCTFSSNSSGGTGGAISNENGSSPIITNCVLWNNGDNGSGADIYNDGSSSANVSYSYTQTTISGTGNITGIEDPFIDDSNPAGGDGLWMTPDDGLELNPLSVAVNAGTPDTTGLNLPTLDIVRNPRIGTGIIEMGAYEITAVTVLYVDANNGADANTGAFWSQSLQTLTRALQIANDNPVINTISVAQGYYSTDGSSTDTAFAIYRGGLKIYGGYPTGGGTRNITSNPTYLNGNTNNHLLVIASIDAGADSIVIDGFTIQYSSATGTGNYTYNNQTVNQNQGGGLVIAGAANGDKVSIRNCNFTNNTADDAGAAIYINNSSPIISNCIISGNIANNNGAAIYTDASASPIISNCIITGNYAVNKGAGIYNANTAGALIINTTIAGNKSGNGGAALYNSISSSATHLQNCIVWSNSSGVQDDAATLTVTYSIMQDGQYAASTGNMNTDPLFLKSKDYTLAPLYDGNVKLSYCSAAKNAGDDAGINQYIGTTDATGNNRYNGPVDIGAYELPLINIDPDATTLYVDATNGDDANTGASWDQANKTLQHVLSIAGCNTNIDSILVATGTYYPGGTQTDTDPETTFGIYRGGLKLYGGYPAGGGTRDLSANPVYLDGQSINNHVMVIAGIASNADSIIIDGFTIQNGSATGNDSTNYNGQTIAQNNGGAVAIVNVASPAGKLVFRNTTLSGNMAANNGGAIYSTASSPLLANCILSGNKAYADGGAIYNEGTAAALFNCSIAGNNAAGSGAAIYNDASSTTQLKNCIVSGNSAGITDAGTTSTVTYSLIQDGQYAGGTGNLSGNNPFVNVPDNATAPFVTGDYHLSPCINAYNAGDATGISQYIGSTDIVSNNRYVGVIDMGAYEMTTTPSNSSSTFYVDGTSGNDANDGSSWTHALKTVKFALDQANIITCIDTIKVAKGTYYPTGNQSGTNRKGYFKIIRGGISLLGGYDAITGTRNVVANVTYLDGDIGTAGDSTDNTYHVLVISGSNNEKILVDGFTVRNGNANVSNNDDTYNSKLFRSDYGGGINISSNYSNTITIKNCVFTHNNSISGGGGSTCESTRYVSFINCTYTANTSNRGAGYYAYSCTGNSIDTCTFTGNYCTSGGGAGIFAWSGSGAQIRNCIFSGNASLSNGGGINFVTESTYTISNSLFSGNAAAQSGGGIWTSSAGGAVPEITNCTFSGNKALSGGAINYTHSASQVNTRLSNCNIWGNSSAISDGGYTMDVKYSNIEGGYSGTNNMNIDPLFKNQLNYSVAPFSGGDYSLTACSPVIDKGNGGTLNSTDLAHGNRIIGPIDMGAYEFDPTHLPVPTIPGTYQSSHFIKDGNVTHFYNCDNILLSLNLTSSGAVIPVDGVKVLVGTGATYYPYGTGFVNNTNGTVLYNRQWTVNPTTQPSPGTPVTVYSYYTTADYVSVRDTLIAHGYIPLTTETQMYCYKVLDNLGDFPPIASTSPANVAIYNNAGSPSFTTWQSGTFGINKYAAFKVSSFSGGGGGGNPGAILPVQLITFTGKESAGYNLLNWQIAPTAIAYFDIERSADQNNFTVIGSTKVPSILQVNYNFYDKQPLSGINYYRLKMVDENGHITYSRIIMIGNSVTNKLMVWPVPATQQVTITNSNQLLNGLVVIVTDMQGKVIHRFTMKAVNTIDIRTWATGVYNVGPVDGRILRIVKQ